MSPIEQLLPHALNSGIDVLLLGPPASGKTSLAKEICPDAPIIHGEEIQEGNRMLLRSLGQSEAVVIVENITPAQFGFLQPIIRSRSVLGTPLKSRFLLTAREPFGFDEGITLALNTPPVEAWVAHSGAHPALTALVGTQPELYERFGLRRLDTLSRLLRSRPSEQILSEAIAAVIGDEPGVIEVLEREILGTPKATGAYHSPQESGTVFHTTKEQSDRYAEGLIKQLIDSGSKEVCQELMNYLKTLPARESIALLAQLLHATRAQEALRELLQAPAICEQIDTLIAAD